jgi:hypothetical protein
VGAQRADVAALLDQVEVPRAVLHVAIQHGADQRLPCTTRRL